MTRIELLLHRHERHPGYEYQKVDSSHLLDPDEIRPPEGEGWELSVNTFPDDGSDGAGYRTFDFHTHLATTSYWRRKVREVSDEELAKVAIAHELHPSYEYDLLCSTYRLGSHRCLLTVSQTEPHSKLSEGWVINYNSPTVAAIRGDSLNIRIYRRR